MLPHFPTFHFPSPLLFRMLHHFPTLHLRMILLFLRLLNCKLLQSAQTRQRAWRLNKAAQEDEELMARGEPPRKRLAKEKYHYTCKGCGQDKSKQTGHTQLKGRCYCPESGQTLDDSRKSVGL